MPESSLLGLVALALGLAGWLLPLQRNPLALRRSYRGPRSETANRRAARSLGCLLIAGGLLLLLGRFLPSVEDAGDPAEAAGTVRETTEAPSADA